MTDKIKGEFAAQQYICTTADLWTQRKRSYLGVTGPYIDAETFDRRSYALACRRIKGSHTHDKIGKALFDVHANYAIVGKITHTDIDNASNFGKAFATLAEEVDKEPAREDSTPTQADDEEEIEESEDEEPAVIEDITIPNTADQDELDASPDMVGVRLPPQLRCGSHTLNLVASVDADPNKVKAVDFKKIHRSAFSKVEAFWNKLSRSSVASDACVEICGTLFRVPIYTRWNAKFDSAVKLVAADKNLSPEEKTKWKLKINKLLEKTGLLKFTTSDFEFIEEWIAVMKPVARCLDILQGEKNCSLGMLLPCLLTTVKQLESMKDLKYCSALRDVLVESITKRFQNVLNFDLETSREFIIAAVSHPRWKIGKWIPKSPKDHTDDFMGTFISACERESPRVEEADSKVALEETSSCSKEEDDFFAINEDESEEATTLTHKMTPKKADSGKQQALRFLADGDQSLIMLDRYELVKNVFIRHNVSLPSSAPVERLFCSGGQILTPRRNRLSDARFEQMLLLKANKL